MTNDIDVIKEMAHAKTTYSDECPHKNSQCIPDHDHPFSFFDNEEAVRRMILLGASLTNTRHMEDCVERQCSHLVNLIDREFISTGTEYRPLDLRVITHRFATDLFRGLSAYRTRSK